MDVRHEGQFGMGQEPGQLADDFFAEYDAFLKTREIYKGCYTDDHAYLANGIDPNKADNIHYQFNKICRRLLVNPNDIDMGELNSEEKHNISVALVRGFQELLYVKAGSRRIGRTTVNQYTNVHTGERGISEYEISSHSLVQRIGSKVRAIDIVHKLGYSKPSVSIAMKNLKAKGFVEVIRNTITLTPKGLEIAEKMYERHKWVSEFFKTLGVPEDIATSDD